MISIIHPSRGRPEQAYLTFRQWALKSSPACEIEYFLSLDTDDIFLPHYKTAFKDYPNVLMMGDNQNAVQAVNNAAIRTHGNIIVSISDDFRCFENWDVPITKALFNKSGLLKTYDGIQKWIVTLPIMTRDYYESQGHVYDPAFEHMFCDTQLTHIADITRKLIIRNDIVFKHEHYSVTKGKKDSITIKADSTWERGKGTYLNNCRKAFGIPNGDIYNLSSEAQTAGHVGWLKKELRGRR